MSTGWCAGNVVSACRPLDREDQPIVGHFIPMLFCEGSQVGVCRITFMSDMCRKDTAMGTQRTFSAHSACVLNHLAGVEMIVARLFWTVGMIQDYSIKPHLVLAKNLPRRFEQRRSIRTVEDSAAVGFNRIQHRSHPGCMVGGKGHHRIWPNHKGLQGLDLVHLEVKNLLCFRRQQTVTRKVSLKRLCGSFRSLAGSVKVEDRRPNHAIAWAAREEMRQVQMIGVRMGLQAISYAV